ncbi:MAG TPA: hypothetical protein PKW42_09110 [bacterium]|nr:hypothetical protein [bacterium]
MGQKEVIRLVFRACASEENSYDRIKVSGSPSFEVRIDGGIHGDVATSAIVINAVHAILKMPPGLWTMPEIPVACFRRN